MNEINKKFEMECVFELSGRPDINIFQSLKEQSFCPEGYVHVLSPLFDGGNVMIILIIMVACAQAF